jgi:RNA polymerase sigma factor (sigma-70 family)
VVEKLVEENKGLIGSVMSRMEFRNSSDREDAWADGMAGLYRAASKFDVSRGCRFSTFATALIHREILRQSMFRDSIYRVCDTGVKGKYRYVKPPLSSWAGHNVLSRSVCVVDDLDELQHMLKLMLRELMTLPWRIAEPFRLRMQGVGYKEIGIAMGYSNQRAHQSVERAHWLLQKVFMPKTAR